MENVTFSTALHMLLSNGLVTSFGLESVPGCCHPSLRLGTKSRWRLMWHGWLYCDNCWASTSWALATTLGTFFIVFLSSLPSGYGGVAVSSLSRGEESYRGEEAARSELAAADSAVLGTHL